MNRKVYIPGRFIAICLVFVAACMITSCGPTKLIRKTFPNEEIEEAIKGKKPLKMHMMDGGLYVLFEYSSSDTGSVIEGYGYLYNHRRNKIMSNYDHKDENIKIRGTPFKIPVSEIALVEANYMNKKGGNIAGITVFGGFGAILSIYCMINPKACFGSCPTFYTFDGEEDRLMAEGFSSSILPCFEKRDVDMFYRAKANDSILKVTVTNEALETHIIRYANIYAFPRTDKKRVFACNNNEFYSSGRVVPPLKCTTDKGNCLEKVIEMDHAEQFSLADSNNLLTEEYIELSFLNPGSCEAGLVIGSRQTLMTTYLFYQGLAYAGQYSGYMAALIEGGNKGLKRRFEKVWDLLGQIEVYVKDDNGKWKKAGEVDEMGPIASDVHLVKIPSISSDTINVRIQMTKGLWRIDYLALATLDERLAPERIEPYAVIRDSLFDAQTLALLHDTVTPLITYPGDRYDLFYALPDFDGDLELFLETKGYYLEWSREEWLEEEDLKKARRMFIHPRKYLHEITSDYKAMEPVMEEDFWNSRYVKDLK